MPPSLITYRTVSFPMLHSMKKDSFQLEMGPLSSIHLYIQTMNSAEISTLFWETMEAMIYLSIYRMGRSPIIFLMMLIIFPDEN